MRELLRLNPYFFRYKWRFFSGILFVVISTLLRVYSPNLVGEIIDNILSVVSQYPMGLNLIPKTLQSDLWNFLGLYFLISLAEGFFVFMNRQTIIVVSRLIEYDIKNAIFTHYQLLDLSFYRKNNTGDLMNRITEDVSRVRMYLGPAIMYLLSLFFTLLIVIPILFHLSEKMAWWVLLPLPFLSVTIYLVNNRIDAISEKLQEKLSDLTSYAQEIFSGIRVVKSFSREKSMHQLFAEQSDEYMNRAMKLARMEALWFPSMNSFIGISLMLTIYFGGLSFFRNEVSAGDIAQYILYLNMLMWPVTSLGWVAGMIQRAITSQRRINEFLDTKPIISPGEFSAENVRGEITFKDVSFVYPDTGIQALSAIRFTIPAGQTWAILGKTGSGKTTIADLMAKMYQPTQGAVLVDGIATNEWKTGNLRRHIGYVSQDVFLFSEAIHDNITFGCITNAEKTAVDVAKMAAVHDDIIQFTDGYDTIVGERGVTLSGGQKQRITIARALYRNPDILILDDCLSAVDATTEKSIQDALSKRQDKKTTIIVTHRLFEHMRFDYILVLDSGKIIERGTPEELASVDGWYSRMLNQHDNQKGRS